MKCLCMKEKKKGKQTEIKQRTPRIKYKTKKQQNIPSPNNKGSTERWKQKLTLMLCMSVVVGCDLAPECF